MARNTMEAWLRDEQGSDVIRRIEYNSVAESDFRSVPMSGATKTEPRMADMSVAVVAKGAAYGEDTASNDEVLLTAIKFGTALRIAEEDIDDQLANLIEAKKQSWASNFGVFFDNAVLGTTAAANGGTVPFTSIYRAITQADAAVGYTANANYLSLLAANVSTGMYDALSNLAAKIEGSGYGAGNNIYVAHPIFRGLLRNVKDTTGQPIFNEGSRRQGDPDTLFGYPIKWSGGAVTTATASGTQAAAVPTAGAKGTAGNPLIFFGNPDFAIVGKRSGVESVLIDGRDGLSALTDETILKVRARRAFVLGNVKAWAVLEVVFA
ncbi:major capsid protein [Microbacterium phage OscarSo]|uniref:Major capsid protein n=1 Tax=Microbacterium phage OscarSo TaxID=2985324 RepID=A0A9X9K351_9CAUD|nr:major capsid protein [Microbacterium phage OscarSo]UYL87137.1 major capsid protein [Microbacterium phage OscarSo]